MKTHAITALLLVALTLTACGSGNSAPTAKRIYAEEALADAPVVSSRAAINRYAGIFGAACLDQAPAFESTAAAFENNGFKLIQGGVGGNEKRGGAYSDGTAYAHLFIRKDGFGICEVAFKTPDDDPLLQALSTEVRGSQFADAETMGGGLVGPGYMIRNGKSTEVVITVSRQKRSVQSPTSFRIMDFNR